MTLPYWGARTCAIGIHLLPEEVGAPYSTEKLDGVGGEAACEPFLSVSPKIPC